MQGTTKEQLEFLANQKLSVIKLAYSSNHHDAVRSESGMIIELGLKSVICKREKSQYYPDHQQKYRVHDLNRLISLARLEKSLMIAKGQKEFYDNWSLLSKWNVNLRYKPIGENSEKIAKQYLDAVESKSGGVYPWVKNYW